MTIPPIILIYFFYGLAFFSMGLLVLVEGGRALDARLRRALRPLAAFGLVHALHEWLEMFEAIASLDGDPLPDWLFGVRLAMLAFSFLSLGAFGSYLLAVSRQAWRLSLLAPLGLEAVWVFGILLLKNRYPIPDLWTVADVWTRYALAIPSALLAAVGLVMQQRVFRRAGLATFGRDALWAAVALGWYGLVGQIFVRASALPPSNVLNEELFLQMFGIPVQLFRAVVAVLASVFIMRFLRAFQVEIDGQIARLQEEKLREAEQREALRGEMVKRVIDAQESERQRIARELHDETGQALTAIGLGLRGLTTALQSARPRKGTAGPSRADQTLHQLQNLTAHSLTELQRLIADLRPSHLDDLGLHSALRWYSHDLGERAAIKVEVEFKGEERELPPQVKTALFRISQEALTNAVKHALADHVRVTLYYAPETVSLRITDDGQGFDLPAARLSQRISWGLKNMEERATLLGGRFTIRSRPGQGTTVEISIPIQAPQEENDDDPSAAGG
ncbi:MAG: sensor histidine kinase [Anaerolineales bacterium]|nr:sensor histidine kinase [Anaerolineales bacterium]